MNATTIIPLSTNSSSSSNSTGSTTVALVTIRWSIVYPFLSISLLIIVTLIFRVLHSQVTLLHRYLPESCFLMIVGAVIEAIRRASDVMPNRWPVFDFYVLFWILIPSGMFESAMQMHNRAFFNNVITILSYAIIGTVLNTALIGMIMYAFKFSGAFFPHDFTLHEILLYSSLISAVDPVAVLAIFEELHVNKDIYYMVFGESVLNDAVVVTIFNIISSLSTLEYFDGLQWFFAILGFFINSFAGCGIGIFYAVLAIFLTKYTENLREAEPMIMMTFAYASYMTSELLQFSSIMAIISNGLVMAQYMKYNISKRSKTSIRYLAKTIATTADGAIFYFLGTILIGPHSWNTGFILIGFALCLFVRTLVTYGLSFFSNVVLHRIREITYREQFLISYGGLRGAIAYALATSIPTFHSNRNIIITATLFVIFITVFVMGTTTKPLVRLLGIRIETEGDVIMFEVINNRVIQFSTRAMEDITGLRNTNTWLEKFHTFNEHYLMTLLVRRREGITTTEVIEAYEEVVTKEALEMKKPNPIMNAMRKSANLIRSKLRINHQPSSNPSPRNSFSEDARLPYNPPRYTQVIKEGSSAGSPYPGDYRLVDKLPLPEDSNALMPPAFNAYQEPGMRSYNSYSSNHLAPHPPPPPIDGLVSKRSSVSNDLGPNARQQGKPAVRNWIYGDPNSSISMIGGGGPQNRTHRMQPATRRINNLNQNYSQMLDQVMATNEFYRNEFRLRNDEDDDLNENEPDPRVTEHRPSSGLPPQYNRSNELFDRRVPPQNQRQSNASQYVNNPNGSENHLFYRKR